MLEPHLEDHFLTLVLCLMMGELQLPDMFLSFEFLENSDHVLGWRMLLDDERAVRNLYDLSLEIAGQCETEFLETHDFELEWAFPVPHRVPDR